VEIEQQDESDTVAFCAPLSSMSIWSQRDCVFGVEHSANFEEKRAQAESGTGPSPATLNANAIISSRRISFKSTTQAIDNLFNVILCRFLIIFCESHHIAM
jgi:hypothetical protein